MLIDKGYYDYDYEPAPPRAKKTDIKKAREKFRGFFSHTKFYNNTDKQETAIDALSRVQREANEQHKSKDNG